MVGSTKSASQKFVRDRVAWFSYLMIATYCYTPAALGPLMTFLRAEMQLSYAMAAYHFSAFSFGSVVAGFSGDKTMKALGRRKAVFVSCIGFCLGLLVIMGGRHPLVTISGAFLCGITGSTMSQTLCAVLADRFTELRAIAITEANIAASFLCSLAPLAVGKLSQSPLGWRAALMLPIIAFICYFAFMGKALDSADEPEQASKQSSSGSLPRSYWLYWCLIFLSVACEWSMVFWSADFLEKVALLSKADAATSVTSFLAAMVTGRILGSRLAREMKSQNLLRLASILAIAGFLTFWLNHHAFICVLGLFITGLGISNFYPITLSLAIGSAPGLTSKATSRMSLSSGGAILVAPLLLGIIAQRNGISAAYGLIAVLLCFCSVMVFLPIWQKPDSKRQAVL